MCARLEKYQLVHILDVRIQMHLKLFAKCNTNHRTEIQSQTVQMFVENRITFDFIPMFIEHFVLNSIRSTTVFYR